MKWIAQLVALTLALLGGVVLERYVLGGKRGSPGSHEAAMIRGDDAIVESKAKPGLAAIIKGGDHRSMDRLRTSDLASMLTELRDLNDGSPEARQAKRELYERWVHADPRGALAYALKEEKNLRLVQEIVHRAFAELAKKDLGAAMKEFATLGTRRQREEAVEAMAHHVKLEDMGTLAEFLVTEMPNAPSEALFRRWAERAPDDPRLMDYAKAGGRNALRAVASGLAINDAESALHWSRMVDESLGMDTTRAAVGVLAHHDPMAAAEAFESLPLGPQRNQMAREIAHRLAQDDVQAALSWAQTLDPAAQRGALHELTQEWARQDPKAAGEFALSLAEGDVRNEAISAVAHHLAESDPGSAVDWVNQLEGSAAASAMRGLVGTIAEGNPQAASALLAQMAPSEAFRDMAGDLAGHWTRFDPNAAAQWAQSLPQDEEVQRHAVARVAREWVEMDSRGASEWIGTLPQGEMRDAATNGLVDHIAPIDPDAAYRWALTVSDPGQQSEMLHHVFEQWRERDPQAAQSTFEAAPISAEQREGIGRIFRGDSE